MIFISFITIDRAIDDCGGSISVLTVGVKDPSEGGSGLGSEGMK